MMNLKTLRLTGFFGLAAPVLGLIIVASSILMAPWFSWTGNALSDLGGTEGPESILFNAGLPMTAALMMMFSGGLFEMTKGNIVGQVGSGFHLAASFLLAGIGVANITIEPWHYYVSVGFFVTLPLSAVLVGYFCFKNKMRYYTLLSWGTAALAGAIWLLPWGAIAIPEALSVSYIGVWQMLLAWWMWTRKEDKLEE